MLYNAGHSTAVFAPCLEWSEWTVNVSVTWSVRSGSDLALIEGSSLQAMGKAPTKSAASDIRLLHLKQPLNLHTNLNLTSYLAIVKT